MENKQLIVLKVVVSNHDNHRLILVNKDFKKLVEGKKFNSLKIQLTDDNIIDFTKSINLYTTDGALAQKGRISTWIIQNGFINDAKNVFLLFELTINEKEASHFYRYLGDAVPIYNEINEIRKGEIQ